MALGEYELAMADFEQCVKLDPTNQDNLICLQQAIQKLEVFVAQAEAEAAALGIAVPEEKDSEAQTDAERQLAEMEERSALLEK